MEKHTAARFLCELHSPRILLVRLASLKSVSRMLSLKSSMVFGASLGKTQSFHSSLWTALRALLSSVDYTTCLAFLRYYPLAISRGILVDVKSISESCRKADLSIHVKYNFRDTPVFYT